MNAVLDSFASGEIDVKLRSNMISNAWELLTMGYAFKQNKLNANIPVHLLRIDGEHRESQEGDYGWWKYCESGVKCQIIDGTHETMLHQPFVTKVAQYLDEIIKEYD